MNISRNTKKIILTSLFAAMICIATFTFRIPTGFSEGYIHIGDVIIYLAASIIPTPYAMLAAAIGSSLADALSGGVIWIIPTIIIKSIMVLFFTYINNKVVCKRNYLAVFFAGLTGWLGYYLAAAIIAGNFIAPLVTIFIELLQPIASGIIFIFVGYALDKIEIKEKISL